MKRMLVLCVAACAIGSAVAQTRVGVSIDIHQPGVYGRINIGDLPMPALVLPQPVIIAESPRYVERRPIYLYVPPTHQRNWRRYCGRYNACGQPVYFVRDQWVRERYEREHPGWDRGRGSNRKEDARRGRDRDHDRDRNPGRGRGPDRDKGR